jgi:hypothetical protein
MITQTDKHPLDKDTLQRLVAGALKDTLNAHGKVDRSNIGSLSKRIAGALHRTLCTLG